MNSPIYLDYSATTPLRPEVCRAMEPYLAEEFGNPSSIHSFGQAARAALEEARSRMAQALDANRGRLTFTGSGSEADNLAVIGFARRNRGCRIIRSSIEHKAIIQATAVLAADGYDIRIAPVDARGVVDLEKLGTLVPMDGRPTLVSVMWANNETGVVQPIESIAQVCRERGAVLHTDAVQAFGKIPVSADDVEVDMLTLSAHKIGGPKGVGVLLVRDGTELQPLVHGGGQEGGLRSGTENVAGIVGFAVAASIAATEREAEAERLGSLRDRLERGLRRALPQIVVNGGDAPERLPNVLNISVPEIDIEGLLTSLDLESVCISSGSACTTGSVEPSHVLVAMGRGGDYAQNTVRFSLGWKTEPADIEFVLETMPRVVKRVREFELVQRRNVTAKSVIRQ